MGNPRIREEAVEEKEEDNTDGVATNGQRVMPRLESKRKQKNEELIGNSRPSLKKSPCDRLSRTDMSSLKKEKQKTPPAKGHDMN
jgi:hypothetical protein